MPPIPHFTPRSMRADRVVPIPHVGADVLLWVSCPGDGEPDGFMPVAAKITSVVSEPTDAHPHDAMANLVLFDVCGVSWSHKVPYSPEPRADHWTWPELPGHILVPATPPGPELAAAASVVVSEDDGQAD